MTLWFWDVLLYAGALLVLFLTPGPVWVGLIARSLSGGFQSAWPLALGVAVGDVLWSLLAIFGVTWVLSIYGTFIEALKWVASGMFLTMGLLLIYNANKIINIDKRLTSPWHVSRLYCRTDRNLGKSQSNPILCRNPPGLL